MAPYGDTQTAERTYNDPPSRLGRALSSDQPQASREMTPEEKVEALFTYHSPDPGQAQSLETVRGAAKHLAAVILRNTPPGADQSAAMRKLREAVMTANAAIVLHGLSF